jgi:hypothetical protein
MEAALMPHSKPVSVMCPIIFFGGVLFLCGWILHGDRIFLPFSRMEHALADDVEAN